MKPFYVIFFIVISTVSFATANTTDKYTSGNHKFIKSYDNSAGEVTFNHTKHAESFIDDCGFCHSALRTFGGQVNELFGHKVCRVCHETHNGPLECNKCHGNQKKTR